MSDPTVLQYRFNFRRLYWKSVPLEATDDLKAMTLAALVVYSILTVVVTVQIIWYCIVYYRSQYKSKTQLVHVLLLNANLIGTSLAYQTWTAIAYATGGEGVSPYLIELILIIPFLCGMWVGLPPVTRFIQVVTKFHSSPLAKSSIVTKLNVTDNPVARRGILLELLIITILIVMGGLLAAVPSDADPNDYPYYSVGVRIQSALLFLHDFVLFWVGLVSGRALIQIIESSTKASQQAPSTAANSRSELMRVLNHQAKVLTSCTNGYLTTSLFFLTYTIAVDWLEESRLGCFIFYGALMFLPSGVIPFLNYTTYLDYRLFVLHRELDSKTRSTTTPDHVQTTKSGRKTEANSLRDMVHPMPSSGRDEETTDVKTNLDGDAEKIST